MLFCREKSQSKAELGRLCVCGLLIVLMLCHMIQVQEAVHGVTIDECQAALQNHSWNVQKAVHYLKVSHPRNVNVNRYYASMLIDVLLSLLLYFTRLLYYCSTLVELQETV